MNRIALMDESRMPRRILLAVLFALWSALVAAQGVVYESKGAGGAVFSDQPLQGSKPLDLPPLNSIDQPPQIQQVVPDPTVAPAPYGQLVIVSPANDGTIHSNTGAFDIQLQIQPALQQSRGDIVRVKLDGNLLMQGYSSAAIHVEDSDWAYAAVSDNVEHRLQAAIVDASGNVLIESPIIRFYAHRAAVGRRVIHH